MLELPELTQPGLFVTGTDTEVGKTAVCCAIAAALLEQQRRLRLGVLKPFATGCRVTRDGLVNEDAEALLRHSGCPMPLELVSPVRMRAPLAPAVAAEKEETRVDWPAIAYSLSMLDQNSDAVLVEGVGGVMVPLDPRSPRFMVGQLAEAIGYPVIVVCRAGLGTLNHTAMTVETLRQAGCRVSGLVINAVDLDEQKLADDPSARSNREWLERLTGVKVLAQTPHAPGLDLAKGPIDRRLVTPLRRVPWADLMRVPVPL